MVAPVKKGYLRTMTVYEFSDGMEGTILFCLKIKQVNLFCPMQLFAEAITELGQSYESLHSKVDFEMIN